MDMERVDIKSPNDFPALNAARYGFGRLSLIRDFQYLHEHSAKLIHTYSITYKKEKKKRGCE
jgi:hypothetical protein